MCIRDRSLRDNEAKEISAVENVSYKNDFEGFLNRLFSGVEDINVYLDMERDSYNSLSNIVGVFAKELIEKYPYVRVKNVYPKVVPLRLVKSKDCLLYTSRKRCSDTLIPDLNKSTIISL